jgi:hypothetical protein
MVYSIAPALRVLHHLCHGRTLLTDRHIDAVELGLVIVARCVDRFLVDDGVDRNSGLTGLTVTDDQLALATANRISASIALRPVCIGSCTDLRGIMPGAFTSTRRIFTSFDRAFAVDRVTQRIDHAAEQTFAHRHVHDLAGTLNDVAFFDRAVVAENNHADIVGFKVQRHAFDAAREFNHLTGADIVQAVNTGHAVTDGEHLTDFGHSGPAAPKLGDLFFRISEISAARISIFYFSFVRSQSCRRYIR